MYYVKASSLHSIGLVSLPFLHASAPQLLIFRKRTSPPALLLDTSPVVTSPGKLRPVTIVRVTRTPSVHLYRSLVHRYHYLGYTTPAGEHLKYVAFSAGRPVACIGWMSAPPHISARDSYLGWTRKERIANLHKIVINTRFLIVPWVHVPHLASHLPGLMARRIASDWNTVYCHPMVWLETFVDPVRGFTGTCYKAGNRVYPGLNREAGVRTTIRENCNRSLKYVFGYPLVKDYRKALLWRTVRDASKEAPYR